MSETHIELPDPEGQLEEEIANPEMTRRDVAITYGLALHNPDRVDWPKINLLIINRWSRSGLEWIKRFAWRQS